MDGCPSVTTRNVFDSSILFLSKKPTISRYEPNPRTKNVYQTQTSINEKLGNVVIALDSTGLKVPNSRNG